MGNSQELVIGLITKPHGIKGELCVTYYAESLFLLKAPLLAYAEDSEEAIEIKISKYKQAKGHIIVSVDGCNDRDKAEEYRNYEICIDAHTMQDFLHKYQASSRQGKNEEEVFIYQLIGLDVFTLSDGAQSHLGELKKVDFMGGKEIWTILSKDNKEILFPAVPEFVSTINIEEKKVIITPPEGLIELYYE